MGLGLVVFSVKSMVLAAVPSSSCALQFLFSVSRDSRLGLDFHS